MIELKIIDEIIKNFYDKAKKDILIGYHFRVIDDFDKHIPKIVSFWELQLNKTISNKDHLPFNILKKHKPLKINRGEVFRWEKLFELTLDEYIQKGLLSTKEKQLWMTSVEFFKQRILSSLS